MKKILVKVGWIVLIFFIFLVGWLFVDLVILNSPETIIDDSMYLENEVGTFNEKIKCYEGENVEAITVKELINQVNAINESEINIMSNINIKLISEEEKKVDLGETEIENSNKGICTYKASGISNSKTYSVLIAGYSNDGRINTIKITEN